MCWMGNTDKRWTSLLRLLSTIYSSVFVVLHLKLVISQYEWQILKRDVKHHTKNRTKDPVKAEAFAFFFWKREREYQLRTWDISLKRSRNNDYIYRISFTICIPNRICISSPFQSTQGILEIDEMKYVIITNARSNVTKHEERKHTTCSFIASVTALIIILETKNNNEGINFHQRTWYYIVWYGLRFINREHDIDEKGLSYQEAILSEGCCQFFIHQTISVNDDMVQIRTLSW